MGMPSAAAALDVASSPSGCASRCIAMGATSTGHAIFLPARWARASGVNVSPPDPLAADTDHPGCATPITQCLQSGCGGGTHYHSALRAASGLLCSVVTVTVRHRCVLGQRSPTEEGDSGVNLGHIHHQAWHQPVSLEARLIVPQCGF